MDESKTTIVFTKKVVIGALILCAAAIFLGIYLSKIDPPDITQYYQLLESSQASSRIERIDLSGRQERKGVHKTVVMSKSGERPMLRLSSEQSVLHFDFDKKTGELIEEMEGVSCDQQEGLFYRLPDGRELEKQANGKLFLVGGDPKDPKAWFDAKAEGLIPMQRVRHVNAEQAVYYYKRDLLSAEKVNLVRFNEVSHSLPQDFDPVNPMMHGMAESVKFSMVGSDPSFKAYHLKLTLYSQEGLL